MIAPRVGGGFGPKATAYPEYSIAARAAMDLGRPVRWTETRSENMLSMVHGRAQVQHVELGVKNDGRIVGLRASVVGDGGMYPAVGTILPSLTQLMAQGVYDIPAIDFAWKTVVTNTTTTGAYRGAGRPEATQLLERIIDMAADEIGMDPLEMRRKNFLQPDKFPMTSLTGAEYDNAEHEKALDAVKVAADYDGLRAEQERRRADGQPPRHGHRRRLVRRGHRPARARRRVRLGPGAPRRHVHGHGRDERPRPGPRDRLRPARGGGPRRADGEDQGRPVRHRAGAQRRRDAGVALAADRRQRHPQRVRAAGVAGQARSPRTCSRPRVEDIEQTDGGFGVKGIADREITWAQVATASEDGSGSEDGAAAPMLQELDFKQGQSSFPFGSHIAVVDVDLDTGMVHQRRHVAVDDAGRILNPMLVAGQQHGGIAQGISQALYERVTFDEDGNPTAATSPPTPSRRRRTCRRSRRRTPRPRPTSTRSGRRGSGSRARSARRPRCTTPSIDALSHLGVRHIDMPLTPEAVWRAIEGASARRPGRPLARRPRVRRGAGPPALTIPP